MTDRRAGVLYGVGAYLLWGLLPFYWKALAAFSAPAILSFRVVHGAAFLVALLALGRRLGDLGRLARDRRVRVGVAACGLLIGINWLIYIWAVNAGFIVECSLGYYINPLASVALGVAVLGERVTVALGISVALALAGVLTLALGYGQVPWVALALAASFAAYGLLKKLLGLDAVVGLAGETVFLLPAGLGALGVLAWTGGLAGQPPTAGAWILSVLAGAVTALPLLCFGAAARRLPLSLLGFLQYLAPTLQLLIGTVVYGEAFTSRHWIAFGCIWSAVLVFSGAQVRAGWRRSPADARTPG